MLCIKLESQNIANLLGRNSDDRDLSKFWLKDGLKFMINQQKIKIKTPMLRSDIWHFSDAYIFKKTVIAVTAPDNAPR